MLYNRLCKIKVKHNLLLMLSPPKLSQSIFFNLLTLFYLIQPLGKQIDCFDFEKQDSTLPIIFYVPC